MCSQSAAAMSETKKAPKFLKANKVVLLLNGRMAGKKAVIIKTFDDGSAERQYGHCIVAGIQKYPLKITKSMSEKKIAKRSKVRLRAFIAIWLPLLVLRSSCGHCHLASFASWDVNRSGFGF